MVGKIQRIHARDVWPNEATSFTPWLKDNIDVLNESIGLSLTAVKSEAGAGTFKVDLVAEDEKGQTVIIENQLEQTDHDHLGKLITYLTALGAKCAIWIVSEPRPEHVRAVSWLNERGSESFFLVRVEAVTIADSPPAALFTVITGPSEESSEAGAQKKGEL